MHYIVNIVDSSPELYIKTNIKDLITFIYKYLHRLFLAF